MQNTQNEASQKLLASKFMSAPQVELKELNNLFFELCYKACNLKCKHCYIEKNPYKQEKDFIPLDKIKNALLQTRGENLSSIYLTGGEPLMHPDFNTILRMCLKCSNVTVMTNGVMINDKKARFLRKIDDENTNETIYRVSLDHFDELKNDEIRGRGSFRKAMSAILNLAKYEFNPIICITDFYAEGKNKILEGLKPICEKIGFIATENNFKINTPFNPNINSEYLLGKWESLDCEYGRILTTKGVYTCPFLANDHRGRSGSDFNDYSDKSILETNFCATCIKNQTQMFSINFKNFN